MLVQQVGIDEIILLGALFGCAAFGFLQAVVFMFTSSEKSFNRMFASVAVATLVLAVLVFAYGGL